MGDLYDEIAEGDEPFFKGMRLHFDNAKRLYPQRLGCLGASAAEAFSAWTTPQSRPR